MKILVTGSEGSLMQFVIPHLIRCGHEVVGVDNFATGCLTLIHFGELIAREECAPFRDAL